MEIPACFFSGISVFGMGCSMEVYNGQVFKCSNNTVSTPVLQVCLLMDHCLNCITSRDPVAIPLIHCCGKTHSPHALKYYHARHQKRQVQIIQLMGKRT